jgi:DEAD/DEAH box helicase domain-containing protein
MLIMRSPESVLRGWPAAILRRWKEDRDTNGTVAAFVANDAPATIADHPKWLSSQIKTTLGEIGVAAPYAHQVDAWSRLVGGVNTVISTPTASGKTLCYNVPVVQRLLDDPEARGMYIFPTKALSRDQEKGIRELVERVGVRAGVFVYDGDTAEDARRAARREARVLITNPDMLHVGILPHHASWSAFLAGLQFVVVDELHTYRGVFGSHVANVFRRLNRIAAFHGSKPTYVACSATIANPLELAETVVGAPFDLVDRSGAPRGSRTFAVYNPGVVDDERRIRRSALDEASRLAGEIALSGRTTLVFCQSRRGVEIVLRYLRERIQRSGGDPGRVRGYRGGYLPTVRREIEMALKGGELQAVVATNALELGIDIGGLDAVVLAGYPGTIAALRQRAGRAGRRQEESLAVLVTTASPLDQFLAREPAYLIERTPEKALAQPDNVEILLAHLKCAAFELPFTSGERFGTLGVADTTVVLEALGEEGSLELSGGRHYYGAEAYPAALTSLRNMTARRVVVIERGGERPVAEVDASAARRELHDEAIYLSEGKAFQVERLDLEAGRAQVREVEPVYYTVPVRDVALEPVDTRDERNLAGGTLRRGDVRVIETISGFKKVRFHTHENIGFGDVALPPDEMETEAAWFELGEGLTRALGSFSRAARMRGLEGLVSALGQVAALHLMCDPHDMATVVSGDGFFAYDLHSGGVGLSERLYDEMESVLDDTRRLVEGCPCGAGCPSCVGPFEETEPSTKAVAAAIARGIAGLASVS